MKNALFQSNSCKEKFLLLRDKKSCSCMSLPSSCPLSTCLTSFRCFRFFRTISLCFFYQHEFLVSTLQTFLSPLPLLIPYVFRIFFWPVSRNSLINYIETHARKRSTFIAFLHKLVSSSLCFYLDLQLISSVGRIFQVFLQIWQLLGADMAIL